MTEQQIAAPTEIGSRLYREQVLPDEAHEGILRRVWAGTPWIASVWTGSRADGRVQDMRQWCAVRHGPQAWPFGDQPRRGAWWEGSATVFGWTWWGFDTEAKMQEFLAAWPHETGA